MYEEWHSTVPGAVVWRTTATGPGNVLPDGCMDLIWMGGDIVVAGPDTRPYAIDGQAGEHYTGIRLAPGALPGLLGVAACELRNSRIPLRQVMPETLARRWVDGVAEADDPGRALEEFVRARPEVACDARTSEIVDALSAGNSVSTVSGLVNLSERQLHRLSLRQFGYGAKTLARILRFRTALRLAESESSSAAVAARAGYADQAHLIRETRDLAGASFAALVSS